MVMMAVGPFNKTYWPYQGCIGGENDFGECKRWCYCHFKSKNWRNLEQHFAFKREEDFVLFALRWL